MSEVKPLSDDESTQLDTILALIQNDPEAKITITARTLCRVVKKMRAVGPTTVEDADAMADFLVGWWPGLEDGVTWPDNDDHPAILAARRHKARAT